MLPNFRYHPDPVATGNVVPSDTVCLCCGQARGYIYKASVYCRESLRESGGNPAVYKFRCRHCGRVRDGLDFA